DVLSVVLRGRQTELNTAARVGGGRQLAGDVQRRFAEERRIDPVPGEGRRQVALHAAVANGRREGGKVAGQHRRGGNEGEIIGRNDTRIRPLITGEEEHLVGFDRST